MVKTTKGGKTMNPTDAYRKELRKKELKRVRLPLSQLYNSFFFIYFNFSELLRVFVGYAVFVLWYIAGFSPFNFFWGLGGCGFICMFNFSWFLIKFFSFILIFGESYDKIVLLFCCVYKFISDENLACVLVEFWIFFKFWTKKKCSF